MAPFGKIFSEEGNPRTTAILGIAKANGLDLEFVSSSAQNPVPEHTKAHPLNKIPSFLGADGFTLHESIAIAVYVTSQNEKTTLLGKTKQDYASILKWVSFFNADVLSGLLAWYLPLAGENPYNKKSVEDASKKTLRHIAVAEEHLLHNTYLVGDRITLADLFATGIVNHGFKYFFDKKWRSEYPNVTRWYETVRHQPIFSEGLTESVVLLDTPKLLNVDPKAAEKAEKKAGKKSEPKSEPKSEKKPDKKAANDEEDDAAPPEPKEKHPLELLPRATFALDDWKRFYSNNDEPVAMKWFWENVNFEEYSLWKVKYKYNDELTLVFMSTNLIGGFFARLEASRKWLFGALSVYGSDNDSVIQGVFLVRGNDIEAGVNVAPDVESYEYEKLDPTKPEDKELVEHEWSWDRSITHNGKEYPHSTKGKVFK